MGWSPADIVNLSTALMPLITAIIQMVEGLFASGQGAQKKAAATQIIENVVPDPLKPLATAMIDTQVSAMNASGVLKHG
jgi:hypothetical protein